MSGRPKVIRVPLTSVVEGDTLITYPAGTALIEQTDSTVVELYGFPERRRWLVVEASPDVVIVEKQHDATRHAIEGEDLITAWVYKEERAPN